MVHLHDILRFVHVVIFAYWLGGDLGVFFAVRYAADPALSRDERLRFLKLALTLDMAPRSCLVLMLPVGFQLARDLGLIALSGPEMAAIWAGGLMWLALVWAVHHRGQTPQGLKLKRLDLVIRGTVLVVLAAIGAISLVTGFPVAAPWLALKILLFAGVMTLGLLLRAVVTEWVRGFGLLEHDKAAAGRIIAAAHRAGARYALLLWSLLAIMAFLGVVQPQL